MKYLKIFEDRAIFTIGEWVIPTIDSKRISSSRAYKIGGIYSPRYNLAMGLGNFYSYRLETENEYEILHCKESDLRKATQEEIELINIVSKYNI